MLRWVFVCLMGVFISNFSVQKVQAMSSREKEFRFENYDNADEAKAELLRLHPIGSPVADLVKTLEGAGATIAAEDLSIYRNFKEYDDWWDRGVVKMYDVKYDKASPFFVVVNYLKWNGSIQVDINNRIIFLGIFRSRAY